eukprot:4390900-Pyramimonas_sp.AAC.1
MANYKGPTRRWKAGPALKAWFNGKCEDEKVMWHRDHNDTCQQLERSNQTKLSIAVGGGASAGDERRRRVHYVPLSARSD